MEQIMWAWRDKDGKFWNIYPERILVQICSPDYYKSAEERGEGKIVQVKVTEVEE